MSKSLVFLSESLIRSLFANFFSKNEWFAQKTDEQIPNPGTGTLMIKQFSDWDMVHLLMGSSWYVLLMDGMFSDGMFSEGMFSYELLIDWDL